MHIKAVLLRGFAPIFNIATDFVNLFIRRDKKIILFGSWMGNRFADNSRFLFQFMAEHLKEFGLKKVIWVTRDEATYIEIKQMGYEVYKMHSLDSIYYHFKAGVHIVCNIEFDKNRFLGDIMGQFSGRANKFNLWHGIPTKAGVSTNANRKNDSLKRRTTYNLSKNRLLRSIFTPGHWDKAYFASTGAECTRRCSEFNCIDKMRFIECGEARNCEPIRLLEEEINLINLFNNYKKVILYLPTFRDNNTFMYPLENDTLKKFICDNNYLWIEKQHSAAKLQEHGLKTKHFIKLDSKFDINVIISKVDLLITDYSSVCYDAYYHGRSVLYYIPDYAYFISGDRGFIFDFESMIKDFVAFDYNDLLSLIKRAFTDKDYIHELSDKSLKEKKQIYSFNYDYKTICQKLIGAK